MNWNTKMMHNNSAVVKEALGKPHWCQLIAHESKWIKACGENVIVMILIIVFKRLSGWNECEAETLRSGTGADVWYKLR